MINNKRSKQSGKIYDIIQIKVLIKDASYTRD